MRSSLPEYVQWQNAMRPEDTARAAALSSTWTPLEALSDFEGQVKSQLESRYGVVRNNFAEEEMVLSPAYKMLSERMAAIRLRRDSYQTPGHASGGILLKQGWSLALISLFVLCLALLMASLFLFKGLDSVFSSVLGMVASLCIGSFAYVCGVILRQTRHHHMTYACIATLLILAILITTVSGGMAVTMLSQSERLFLGVWMSLAMLAITACAFYSHNSDPLRTGVEREFMELSEKLAQIVAKRKENMDFHLNVAQRHHALAEQMVQTFRLTFRLVLPDGTATPPEFNRKPTLPEIADPEYMFGMYWENTL